MADFPTTEEIKYYVNDKTATANYALVESARYAAIAELNNGCQRQFVVASGSSTRLFVPASCELVRIHDCTAVSAVTNRGVSVSGSAYQLEPVNALSITGETIPYEQIRLLSQSWDFGTSNAAEATVSVTATWGWSSIPYPIIEACKIIAKDILSNRDVRFGLVAVTDVAGVSARTNPIVAAAINTYRRAEAFGIA